eukprot:272287-Chlamydomonas_euryale.AAC.1
MQWLRFCTSSAGSTLAMRRSRQLAATDLVFSFADPSCAAMAGTSVLRPMDARSRSDSNSRPSVSSACTLTLLLPSPRRT